MSARMSDSNQARQKIIQKALDDPSFKQALLQDPKAALEKELGISIPAGVKINVFQETMDELYLVLPFNMDEVEIPDEVLEQVAGVAGGW